MGVISRLLRRGGTGGGRPADPSPPAPPPAPPPRASVSDADAALGSVEGRTFTVTGGLELWESREDLKREVEAAGGRVVGSMSGKVDVLVLGQPVRGNPGTSAAERKAREMRDAGRDVAMVDELRLLSMLGRVSLDPALTLESLRSRPAWALDNGWRRWEEPLSCVGGESHCRLSFALAVGTERAEGYYEPRDLALVREPENAYDSNAVRVELAGLHVGRIARDLAAKLGPAMDAAGVTRAAAPGIVRGGYARGDGNTSFSVAMWLKRVEPALRFKVPRGLDRVPHWPPRAFDGREGGCPECGMRIYMREPKPGRLECTDCGHSWRE